MKTIIFDFNRTLYDPEANSLIDGVVQILDEARTAGIRLCLLSRQEAGREDILQRLNIRKYFSMVNFVSEKTSQELLKFTDDPSNTYVVGDHLHEEIRCGNDAGMNTIWFKSGRFKDLKPRSNRDVPTHIIYHLYELKKLIA